MGADRRDGVNRDARTEDPPSIGSRLGQLSARLGELTSGNGLFYVACARTGVRPFPVAEKRFGTRRLAEQAAVCASNYRVVLRELDPSLPVYDLVANEATSGAHWLDTTSEHAESVPSSNREWEPVSDSDRETRIDFCHVIAGAVLEALSQWGHGAVERACHDAMAGVDETDDRCLRLLEALEAGLDHHLTPDERTRVLREAAGRLAQPSSRGDPIKATLDRLQSMTLIETYKIGSRDADDGTRSVDATLTGYAWEPTGDALPTLPIVVDLYRRRPDLPFSSLRVVPVSDGSCRLEVPTADVIGATIVR